MSEETTIKKPPSTNAVAIGSALVGLVLLALLYYAVSASGEARRLRAMEEGVDGLTKALNPLLIKGDKGQLLQVINQISEAADYSKMTITDDKGKVLASTDRSLDFAVMKELTKAPLEAKATKSNGKVVLTRAMTLGKNNVIGAIQIVTD